MPADQIRSHAECGRSEPRLGSDVPLGSEIRALWAISSLFRSGPGAGVWAVTRRHQGFFGPVGTHRNRVCIMPALRFVFFIFLGNRNLLGFGQFWPSWCLWHLEKFWVRPEITKMEFPGARSCSREKFCQSKSFSLQLRNFFEADTLVRVFLPPPRNCDLLVFGDLSVGSGCCWLRRAGMGSGWEVNKIEKKR